MQKFLLALTILDFVVGGSNGFKSVLYNFICMLGLYVFLADVYNKI